MKIYRIWNISEKILGMLIQPIKEKPLPGDYIEINGRRYPILSVKENIGAIKLEIIGEKDLDAKYGEIIKNNPNSGKFSVIGPINDWIIAGLRLKGYEISRSITDVDAIIITVPELVNIDKKNRRLIFAPHVNSTWQDITKFNNIFDEYGITARYDLSKPILSNSDYIKVYVPSLGGKIIFPAKFVSYEIKAGRDTILLGHIQEKPGTYTLVHDPHSRSFIYSTAAMLMPYDFILEEAKNVEILTSIMALDFIDQRKQSQKIIQTKYTTGDLIFSFHDLDPNLVFNKVIEKISIIGGLLKERNDIDKRALIELPLDKGSLSIKINVSNDTLKLQITSLDKQNDRLRLIIRSLVGDSIRELAERKSMKEEFKKTVVVLLNIQEKLITIKDMIEIELSPYAILEEFKKICGYLSSIPKYASITNEIIKTTNFLETIVKKHQTLPENFKNELQTKIETWLSELKSMALSSW